MKTHILLSALLILLFPTSFVFSQDIRPRDYNYVHLDLNLSSNKISATVLDALCDDELMILRNEIYARHGYVFTDVRLQNLFKNEKWYKPLDDNKSIILRDIHFCQNDGIYSSNIDNGFSDITYYIKINSNSIVLGYHSNGVSDIYPSKKRLDAGIEEDFSAMARVDENILELVFTIDEDNKIEFERISGAG